MASTNSNFQQQLAEFITNNGIVGTCAGVIIGLVTKDVVLSLVADVIVPLCIMLFLRMHTTFMTKILGVKYENKLDVTKFISNLITWFLAIILTYLFIQYAFVKLIGASDKQPLTATGTPKPESHTVETFTHYY